MRQAGRAPGPSPLKHSSLKHCSLKHNSTKHISLKHNSTKHTTEANFIKVHFTKLCSGWNRKVRHQQFASFISHSSPPAPSPSPPPASSPPPPPGSASLSRRNHHSSRRFIHSTFQFHSLGWEGRGPGLVLSIPDIYPIIRGVLLLPLHSSHNSIPFMERGGEWRWAWHQLELVVENGLQCKIGPIALREVITRASSAFVQLSFIPLVSFLKSRRGEEA